MAFPTSPSNLDTYVKDNANIYTYYSASNSWKITGHTGTIGEVYITSPDLPEEVDSNYITPLTSYCINVDNYIYCPCVYNNYDGSLSVIMLYFTTDSSAFPIKTSPVSSGYSAGLSSIYLDSGVIYINYDNGYYTYFTISTKSWAGSYYSGGHTSGTNINSDLELNGFKYEPYIIHGKITHDTYELAIPTCKVTKL